jgi:Zn-dependent peptidase ImmA (M78 family)/DNA-binding XRE family transcriptional regulator
MPVGVKLFNGQRLVQARHARGLTSVNLSSIADVSPSSISLYEKGTEKPQQIVLDRLARALNVPIGFFFSELQIEKPKSPFYRSMSSATKGARSRAEAQFEWALEVIDYLLRFFDFPQLNLPELNVPDNFRQLDTMRIELLASQVRAHWTLGVGPIANMVRTLESNGVVVWRTALEAETLDAFSEYRLPHPVVVLSSDKENYFRSRFDAAHELAHLVLHKNINQTNLNKSSDFKIIEDQAHTFAGAFLLPASSFSNDLWSPTLDAFRSLKPRWNASISMQIMRCRQLGLINDNQEKRLWINLARRKWKTNEPLDDSTPVEKPNLIGKSIKMLIDEKVKSKDQLAQDLSLSASDIEKIGELPFGFIRNVSELDHPSFKDRSTKILPFRR